MRRGLHLGLSILATMCAFAPSGCAARTRKTPEHSAAVIRETPVPTVPPGSPTPVAEAPPVPTHPIGKPVKARKGEAIGPVVTFFGAARADGSRVAPISVDNKGIPTYRSPNGSGFMLVVEAKPGKSGYEPGRRVFVNVPNDPKARPDLEIQSDHDMGNGSVEVCDRQRPNIGGIPAIKPPSFAETQRIADALNDFSCRFETFIGSDSACTMDTTGDFAFMAPTTTAQFCMIVARAYAFPPGETLLSVRVRDSEGNPGPAKQMRIVRPPEPTKKP